MVGSRGGASDRAFAREVCCERQLVPSEGGGAVAVPGNALAAVAPVPTLYASLLGTDWEELPAVVRRLHREGSATGRFRIRRGKGPLAAVAGWLCRFPTEGDDVPTRLVVRRDGPVQFWERAFNGHALVTAQRAWRDGLLAEQLGPVECVFRLRAVDGSLVFEPLGAWLRLGPWHVKLPRLLAPHIEAKASEVSEGMHVRVSIGSPLAGALLTYEGHVQPEEETP